MEVVLSKVPADAPKSMENKEESSTESEGSKEPVGSKVPDQLIMEFLINMMKHDYVTAEKLCQMILLYDPKNERALSFKPLLQEMIQAIKDNAEENGDSSNSSSESEAEDSSESDSDETDSSSNADSEENESDSNDKN